MTNGLTCIFAASARRRASARAFSSCWAAALRPAGAALIGATPNVSRAASLYADTAAIADESSLLVMLVSPWFVLSTFSVVPEKKLLLKVPVGVLKELTLALATMAAMPVGVLKESALLILATMVAMRWYDW
eukprot:CAMPEP_0172551140 /NCGR_PEP_ID=MMETSP1067-20121228/36644_1 /TAXON_ID=265564 ORGANISM="Thalassiosira punctigera, Strain Tpunct2005C2" /NCGR_SAMPLE_ID=MMETSP1067 /ASSEMBLY_ACC=CAM_ASM_000444 /LENGTH=131 /DNA_ID=CAMNT_0013338885 /DNA_START=676 /DNA_END=1068 /DNA_ORIENTATION=-